MARMFFPPPRVSVLDMHDGTCVKHVPWCMPGSLTSGFLWSRWRGKRPEHPRRMCNPQFYATGYKPNSGRQKWNPALIQGGLCQRPVGWRSTTGRDASSDCCVYWYVDAFPGFPSESDAWAPCPPITKKCVVTSTVLSEIERPSSKDWRLIALQI